MSVAPWRRGGRVRDGEDAIAPLAALMLPCRHAAVQSMSRVQVSWQRASSPGAPPRPLIAACWLLLACFRSSRGAAPGGHEQDAQGVLGVLGVLLVARCMGGVALTQSQCRQCRSAARSEIRLAINAARRAYLGLPGPAAALQDHPLYHHKFAVFFFFKCQRLS